MASTRDVISPGVFAEDASTTIPPTPIAGVSYRDPVAGPASVPDGWAYAERVNSAEFNQLMFQYSSLLSIIDKQGLLGWTDLVDYAVPAVVFGSDGIAYQSLLASGPSSAPRDPISNPTYWQEFGGISQADGDLRYAKLAGLATQIFSVAAASDAAHAVRFDQALGLGQTWQVVTGSRALGSTYTNSSMRPRFVMVSLTCPTGGAPVITVAGVNIGQVVGNSNTGTIAGSGYFIVPPGATYSVSSAGASLSTWSELF